MQRFFKRTYSTGFTIVELLIVIVVIGILAAIVIVSYGGIQNAALDKSVLSDADGVEGEVTRYQVKNAGSFSSDGSGSSVTWYSGGSANSNVKFVPSSGNIIDVVADDTTYCIRVYNPNSSTYKTLSTAIKKESTSGVCDNLPASNDAIVAAGGTPANTFTTLTWTQQTGSGSRDWNYINMSGDGTKLVATTQSAGYIYKSTDSGVTWTAMTSAGSRSWSEAIISDDGTKLAAYAGTSLYTSTDSGATWTLRPITSHYGPAMGYGKISGSSDGTKLIMFIFDDDLCGGDTYISTDSGATWATTNRYACISMTAISSDGTRFLGVSTYGYIDRSSDSGATWSQTNAFTQIGNNYWVGYGSAGASSSNLAYLLWSSTGNKLWKSSDNGLNWTQVTAVPTGNYTAAVSKTGKLQYAALSSGAGSVWVSKDFGVTWLEKTGTGARTWRSIAISDDGALSAAVYGTGYIYTGSFQ